MNENSSPNLVNSNMHTLQGVDVCCMSLLKLFISYDSYEPLPLLQLRKYWASHPDPRVEEKGSCSFVW